MTLSREQVIERILEGGLFDCLNDPYDDGTEYGSLMTDCIRLWERAYQAGMESEANLIAQDRQYVAGAKAGWNCETYEQLNSIIEPRLALIREAK